MSRITGTTDMKTLNDVDAVIEAVFEDIEVKKDVFRQLDQICKPGCYLFSNTSALNIDEIAAQTKRPELVCGTHFFSPANVMKLLENVQGTASAPQTFTFNNDLDIVASFSYVPYVFVYVNLVIFLKEKPRRARCSGTKHLEKP